MNTKETLNKLAWKVARHDKQGSFHHENAHILFRAAMRKLINEKDEATAQAYALEGLESLANDLSDDQLLKELGFPSKTQAAI